MDQNDDKNKIYSANIALKIYLTSFKHLVYVKLVRFLRKKFMIYAILQASDQSNIFFFWKAAILEEDNFEKTCSLNTNSTDYKHILIPGLKLYQAIEYMFWQNNRLALRKNSLRNVMHPIQTWQGKKCGHLFILNQSAVDLQAYIYYILVRQILNLKVCSTWLVIKRVGWRKMSKHCTKKIKMAPVQTEVSSIRTSRSFQTSFITKTVQYYS